MATITEVFDFIRTQSNLNDLKAISLSVKNRWSRLQFLKAREFYYRDRVSFYTKDNRKILGRVTKMNKKTITVITDDGFTWRVAPTLLEKEIA